MRKLSTILLLATSLISVTVVAQSDEDKADLKRKIEMSIRRLDMRIDKINKDLEKAKDEKAKTSSIEYRTKLEGSKVTLEEDLKGLATVKKEEWRDFKDTAESHMDAAKESIKPVML